MAFLRATLLLVALIGRVGAFSQPKFKAFILRPAGASINVEIPYQTASLILAKQSFPVDGIPSLVKLSTAALALFEYGPQGLMTFLTKELQGLALSHS